MIDELKFNPRVTEYENDKLFPKKNLNKNEKRTTIKKKN